VKKLLAWIILIAAAAGTAGPSLASNGNHGGGGGGGGPHGGAFHGGPGVHFHGGPFLFAHHPFPFRRGFVVVGAGFPLGYYDYWPVGYDQGAQPVYLYCPNPAGYYPQIQECPTGWVQVLQQ
jgi:hypothetical protein